MYNMQLVSLDTSCHNNSTMLLLSKVLRSTPIVCYFIVTPSFGSAAGRSQEALQEAGRKAARTRAERYGEELKVSDPANDDLQGTKTTVN